MKFLSLALVAFFAEAASATKSLSSDELNAMIRSGKIDTKTLLKHAIPYNKQNLRRLQEGEQENGADVEGQDDGAADADADVNAEDNADADLQEDVEGEDGATASAQQSVDYYTMYGTLGKTGITGDHSVSFNSCVSLSVEEDWELLDNYENLASYIQSEQIQSVRNYVLFNVCETTGDCLRPEISDKNTYMVDLNTWVTAMLNYLPDQKDQYCEGCWNQEEFCEQVYQNGWDRTMNIDYTTAFFFYDDIKFQLIDCDQCQIYGCYNEGGDSYQQNGWDKVDEWISELAQCMQTDTQFMGVNLNAGFMCNQYGSGLEIGIFMDEDCTLYNSQKSYQSTLGDGHENWVNYGKSQRVINYLFNYMFDCYGGDLIYVNLYQQVFLDNNGWQYDPCQVDSSTGGYFDQEACEEMINNNPCYITFDEYGNQNEIDEEECAVFMQEYPCWSMPGSAVADEYKEACYEYQASYSHAANNACMALFGQQNNQQQGGQNQNHNQNQNEQSGEGSFAATALSACAYSYAAGSYVAEGEEQSQNTEYTSGNWTLNLNVDITYDMMYEPTAVCNYMDSMFTQGSHLDTQAYDPTISGQMYSYEDLGSESDATYYSDIAASNETEWSSSNSSSVVDGSSASSSSATSTSSSGDDYGTVYFPTTNNMPKALKNAVSETKRRMSPGAITAIAVGTALGAFVALTAISQMYKRCRCNEKSLVLDMDQKDLPLMS